MPRLQVNLRSGAVLGELCAVPLETVAEREQSIAAVWRGYHETYSGASAIIIQRYWRGYMVRHNLYGKQRTSACKRAPSISPVDSEADSDDFKDGEQGSEAWRTTNQNCWQEQATASAAVKKRTQQQHQPPRSQQAQEAAALVIQRWVRGWKARKRLVWLRQQARRLAAYKLRQQQQQAEEAAALAARLAATRLAAAQAEAAQQAASAVTPTAAVAPAAAADGAGSETEQYGAASSCSSRPVDPGAAVGRRPSLPVWTPGSGLSTQARSQHAAALRIQCWVRGWLARKQASALRRAYALGLIPRPQPQLRALQGSGATCPARHVLSSSPAAVAAVAPAPAAPTLPPPPPPPPQPAAAAAAALTPQSAAVAAVAAVAAAQPPPPAAAAVVAPLLHQTAAAAAGAPSPLAAAATPYPVAVAEAMADTTPSAAAAVTEAGPPPIPSPASATLVIGIEAAAKVDATAPALSTTSALTRSAKALPGVTAVLLPPSSDTAAELASLLPDVPVAQPSHLLGSSHLSPPCNSAAPSDITVAACNQPAIIPTPLHCAMSASSTNCHPACSQAVDGSPDQHWVQTSLVNSCSGISPVDSTIGIAGSDASNGANGVCADQTTACERHRTCVPAPDPTQHSRTPPPLCSQLPPPTCASLLYHPVAFPSHPMVLPVQPLAAPPLSTESNSSHTESATTTGAARGEPDMVPLHSISPPATPARQPRTTRVGKGGEMRVAQDTSPPTQPRTPPAYRTPSFSRSSLSTSLLSVSSSMASLRSSLTSTSSSTGGYGVHGASFVGATSCNQQSENWPLPSDHQPPGFPHSQPAVRQAHSTHATLPFRPVPLGLCPRSSQAASSAQGRSPHITVLKHLPNDMPCRQPSQPSMATQLRPMPLSVGDFGKRRTAVPRQASGYGCPPPLVRDVRQDLRSNQEGLVYIEPNGVGAVTTPSKAGRFATLHSRSLGGSDESARGHVRQAWTAPSLPLVPLDAKFNVIHAQVMKGRASGTIATKSRAPHNGASGEA